jgi:hypothetical protein
MASWATCRRNTPDTHNPTLLRCRLITSPPTNPHVPEPSRHGNSRRRTYLISLRPVPATTLAFAPHAPARQRLGVVPARVAEQQSRRPRRPAPAWAPSDTGSHAVRQRRYPRQHECGCRPGLHERRARRQSGVPRQRAAPKNSPSALVSAQREYYFDGGSVGIAALLVATCPTAAPKQVRTAKCPTVPTPWARSVDGLSSGLCW